MQLKHWLKHCLYRLISIWCLGPELGTRLLLSYPLGVEERRIAAAAMGRDR